MGKLIISTNITLDGVVEDPDGKEGFRLGGWFDKSMGTDCAEWTQVETEEALSARALLLGRRSDEWFAARWTSRKGAWADRLNSRPEYVVSSTLEQAHWTNSKVLGRDAVKHISHLKQQQLDDDIVVYASYRLVRTILEHDLADELRMVVFPVVLGTGVRLFQDVNGPKPMRLIQTERIGHGLAFYS